MKTLLLVGVALASTNDICSQCHLAGTFTCQKDVCQCKSGFTGSLCNTCSQGHFGENCSPAECCSAETSYSHLLFNDEQDRKKGLQGYQSRRRRRQVHIQQHCDYRAELCDVEDALMEMYEAIQLTPPVDDLEPYLKDVHRLQESLLGLQLKIQLHIQSGTDGSHDDFLKNINDKLNSTHFELSKLDEQSDMIKDIIENLAQMEVIITDQAEFDALHDKLEYGLDQDEVDDLLVSIRDAGSELERETGVPLFNDITNLDAREIEFDNYETNLTERLNKIHTEWLEEYEKLQSCTTVDCRPAAEIADELMKLVLKQQKTLPHGHPTIFSWFGDAAEVQQIINDSRNGMNSTMKNLNNTYHLLTEGLSDDLWSNYNETLKRWEDDYIDVRNLIIYIEFLESLAKYPDYTDMVPTWNKDDIDQLFEKLQSVTQQHREAEKQVAFKPVQDEHDEAEDKIKQVKDITKETTKKAEEYEKTATDEIGQAIEDLTDTIEIAELAKRASDANKEAQQVEKEVNEVKDALLSLTDLIKSRNRRKRKVKRELRRRKRNRRQRGRRTLDKKFNDKMDRIDRLVENTNKLMSDIKDYHENSNTQGPTFKLYFDRVIEGKNEVEVFGETLSTICPECIVDADVTLEDLEKNITGSIDSLKEEIRVTTARIYAKIGC